MTKYPNYHIHGENSIIVYFSKQIEEKNLTWITNAHKEIKTILADNYLDGIACYQNLTIFYNINNLSVTQAITRIQQAVNASNKDAKNNTKHIRIPVFYDKSTGLDLSHILQQKSLSKQQFIKLHTQQIYRVYGVGFLANFAYLGNLDKKLCLPRLTTPRENVPAGSVGIADCQTGIYPTTSPAGWHIIGQTSLDLSSKGNITFNVGDYVQFFAIDSLN